MGINTTTKKIFIFVPVQVVFENTHTLYNNNPSLSNVRVIVPQTGRAKQDWPNRTSTAVCTTVAAQAMNARRIERVTP